MDDEYGRESLEIRVPYQGVLRMGSRPRDVYDIAQLMHRGDVDVDAALAALPLKAERKNVDARGARDRFIAREVEYQVNWNHQLAYLVTDGMGFAAASGAVAGLLGHLKE